MPQLPRFTAGTGPGREATTGKVRATDIGALTDTGAGLEAQALVGLGRGISQAAGLAADAYMKRKKLDDDARWGTQTQGTNKAIADAEFAAQNYDYKVDKLLPDDPDYGTDPLELSVKKREKLISDALLDLDVQTGKFRQGFLTDSEKIKYDTWWDSKRDEAEISLRHEYNLKHDQFQVDRLSTLAEDAYRAGDMEAGDSFVDSMDKNELVVPAKATKMKTDGRKMAVSESLSVLKNQGMAGDMNKFDDARDVLQSTSVFNSEESLAELKSIEMLESYTNRKTKDLNEIQNLKVNEDFVSKISAKELKPDEIQLSRLPDDSRGLSIGTYISKQDWMEYARQSYEPDTNVTTPDGMDSAITIITDFGITKEDAYKQLLDARYIDRSISQAHFEWAIEKINNPYPQQMLVDIKTVTDGNVKSMRNLGLNLAFPKKDRERAKAINADLMTWVDSQIEQKKEPTREEMFQKSAELIAGVPAAVEGEKKSLSGLSDEELLKRIMK